MLLRGRSLHQRVSNTGRLSILTQSEQLRVVLETSPSALVVMDEQGIILAFGKAAQALFGYAEDEAVGQNVNILMAPPHAERHDGYLKRYRETGEKRIIGNLRVENARDKEGHIFPVEISIGETHSNGTRYFVGFVRGLGQREEDRKQAQDMLAELAHASRVAAMGAFATAIAHELNQPLTTIANYTEGCRDILKNGADFPDRDNLIKNLDTCSKQALRAGQLIHRLRDFVLGGETHKEAVEVEDLIDNSLTLAMINGFRRNVTLERRIPAGLPRVAVDPLQGQQVLFNLIRNAFESMHAEEKAGQRLRIEAAPGDQGMLEFIVEDSGAGIDPEVGDTLFENFVTTKGGGMGVGLAICRQIVEACGGSIWVSSSAGLGGAKFHFTLPIADN